MQICKIDELKSEINNEQDMNLSFSSSIFNTETYRPQVQQHQQQQQTRDRLANLRRQNFSTAATQSDFFTETSASNPYYNTSMLHFDDASSHSFVNTPRSARSINEHPQNLNPVTIINNPTYTNKSRSSTELYNQLKNNTMNNKQSTIGLKPAYKPAQLGSNSLYSPRQRSVKFSTSQPSEINHLDEALSTRLQGNYTSYNLNDRYVSSRLLMPVISTLTTTTTTTTTNVASKDDLLLEVSSSSNVNSPTTSIVDESKLLLREYEQLRSDSVSEIQRAHDSLNASLKWLENQKKK